MTITELKVDYSQREKINLKVYRYKGKQCKIQIVNTESKEVNEIKMEPINLDNILHAQCKYTTIVNEKDIPVSAIQEINNDVDLLEQNNKCYFAVKDDSSIKVFQSPFFI